MIPQYCSGQERLTVSNGWFQFYPILISALELDGYHFLAMNRFEPFLNSGRKPQQEGFVSAQHSISEANEFIGGFLDRECACFQFRKMFRRVVDECGKIRSFLAHSLSQKPDFRAV